LDRAHAEIDRAADRLRRVGVSEDIGVPGLCLLDDRPHLPLAVLQVPDRVVWRGDAARGQDLDLSRPLSQLVARGAAALRHTVGDAREVDAAFATGTGDDRLRPRPDIAMSAGLAQRHPRRENARPADEAVLDRLREPTIRTSRITDRREAALQHAF